MAVRPEHYNGKLETWDWMKLNCDREEFIGFLKLNVYKYLSRLGKKGDKSDAVKDLYKARTYIDKLITEIQEGE